jgi:hypothetical protein
VGGAPPELLAAAAATAQALQTWCAQTACSDIAVGALPAVSTASSSPPVAAFAADGDEDDASAAGSAHAAGSLSAIAAAFVAAEGEAEGVLRARLSGLYSRPPSTVARSRMATVALASDEDDGRGASDEDDASAAGSAHAAGSLSALAAAFVAAEGEAEGVMRARLSGLLHALPSTAARSRMATVALATAAACDELLGWLHDLLGHVESTGCEDSEDEEENADDEVEDEEGEDEEGDEN